MSKFLVVISNLDVFYPNHGLALILHLSPHIQTLRVRYFKSSYMRSALLNLRIHFGIRLCLAFLFVATGTGT